MAEHDDMPRRDDPTELEPRPRTPPDRGPGATVMQLKQDIDSGATGDKVPVLDPSSTPLGTGLCDANNRVRRRKLLVCNNFPKTGV